MTVVSREEHASLRWAQEARLCVRIAALAASGERHGIDPRMADDLLRTSDELRRMANLCILGAQALETANDR